jgi:hypothetical protein
MRVKSRSAGCRYLHPRVVDSFPAGEMHAGGAMGYSGEECPPYQAARAAGMPNVKPICQAPCVGLGTQASSPAVARQLVDALTASGMTGGTLSSELARSIETQA